MSLAGKMGRLGQMYIKAEATYGTAPALAAANAFRHLVMDMTFSPRNRVNSTEKKQSPGTVNRFTRKMTGAWNLSSAYMIPSGVLNTVPEADPLFLNGFGTSTTRTLATTISAAPSVSGATLTSAATLAPGDCILVTSSAVSPNGGSYVVKLTSVAGAVVQWTPSLPAAPNIADAIKGGITYQLTSENTASLFLAWYIGTFGRAMAGAVVDKLKIMFDAVKEAEFSASGPALGQLSSASGPLGACPAQPGGFTTVGAGNGIPSGLTGRLVYNNALYTMLRASAEITHNKKLRNENYGTDRATEVYQAGRRQVALQIDARVEDPTQIYADGESTTTRSLSVTCGQTVGSIFGFVCPIVEWELPNTPDGDSELSWSFKGFALESADGKNDEIVLGCF